MTETERIPSPQVAQFCERLQALSTADRARLKRKAGSPLAEAGDTLGLFYRLLPYGVSPMQEELWYLAASLYPLAEGGGSGDLGLTLRRARTSANAKGLDRRMATLLDADNSQLPFRLRQTLRYLQSSRIRVNWPGLLDDLLYWSHPDRLVQRRWARNYYHTEQPFTKGTN